MSEESELLRENARKLAAFIFAKLNDEFKKKLKLKLVNPTIIEISYGSQKIAIIEMAVGIEGAKILEVITIGTDKPILTKHMTPLSSQKELDAAVSKTVQLLKSSQVIKKIFL